MDINDIRGLSANQVSEKQQKYGYNELPNRDHRNLIKIIFGLLTEPMIFLLLCVIAVYFVLGDKTEALVLMVSVCFIIGIELYQERKTEKTLEALRNLSSPIADVIRDGKHLTIPGRELVTDDIIMLAEGGRVPADAALLAAENLMVDESILTGESVPVEKSLKQQAESRNQAVFSGSMVVKGHGLAKVTSIGEATEMGKIGSSLNSIAPEKTLLQKEISRVVRIIAIIAVSASLILTLAFWLMRDDLLHGFLAGLTLAIALLPEEFPVVLTIFMALGAWRLARSHVLTRRAHTIETLGSASVLCVDKTGTLTENRMQIAHTIDAHGEKTAELERQTIIYGVLASQKKPFDPMEEAFISAGKKQSKLEEIYQGEKIIKEYPLEEDFLCVVHVWGKEDKQTRVALKGAPETVFKLCKLPAHERARLQDLVKESATQGLRVIAVAKGAPLHNFPEQRTGYDYEFLGLVALADPVRKEAAPAVALCHQAGIRVVMITGDYAETARHIAGQIGLDTEHVITGSQFEKMSDHEKTEAIKTVSVFSRVTPSHKLTIVKALKHAGEVVAMTGDGVNDAPALKAAHIGIAMGKRGTDVAREAATIVLLDDNFASIVQGVRIGRRIFTNLQKAMSYILAVHVPIAMLSLAPVFFGWPLILLPIHIVFLEFIIDPTSTLVFEGEDEEPDSMHKPPRRLHSSVFSADMVLRSLIQGLIVSATVIGLYAYLNANGHDEATSRSMTFLTLVLANLFVIFAVSGKRAVLEAFHKGKNAMVIVVGVTSISLIVIYLTPFLQNLFAIKPLSFVEVSISILLALFSCFIILPLRHLKYLRPKV